MRRIRMTMGDALSALPIPVIKAVPLVKPVVPEEPIPRVIPDGRNPKGQFSKGHKFAKGNTSTVGHYTRQFKQRLVENLPDYFELLDKIIRKEITDAQVDKEALMFAIKLAIPSAKSESSYIELNHHRLNTADQIVKAGDEVAERTASGEMSLEECNSTLKMLVDKVQLLDVAKGATVHDALKNNDFEVFQS